MAVIVIQSTILCSSIRHHDSKKWQIFMKPKLRWYWSWVDFVNSQGYYTVSLLLYRGLVSNAFHMPSIKENDLSVGNFKIACRSFEIKKCMQRMYPSLKHEG